MGDGNWIKLNRKLLEWEWFTEPRVLQVWLYMLLRANPKDKMSRGIMVKRGQFITSHSAIADVLDCERRTISPIIDKLIQSGCIKIEYGNGKRYMIVTIVKYNEYQAYLEEKVPSNVPSYSTSNMPSNVPSDVPLIRNKEEKEEKNISSSTRTREQIVAELGLYWNTKVNIITKQIPKIDNTNPERLGRMLKILDTYGEERIKTAIDIVATNNYLKNVGSFDGAIVDPVHLEKILAGYYKQRPKTNANGNSKSKPDFRRHVTRTEGPTWTDIPGWEEAFRDDDKPDGSGDAKTDR